MKFTAGWTRGGEKTVPLHEVMSWKVKLSQLPHWGIPTPLAFPKKNEIVKPDKVRPYISILIIVTLYI